MNTESIGGASEANGDASQSAEGTSELFTAVGRDLRAILQEELSRFRADLGDSVRDSKRSLMLLGGAGVLGALATGTSAAALVRVLTTFLPRPVAALIATAMYGAGAVALARLGLAELRRARQSLPRP